MNKNISLFKNTILALFLILGSFSYAQKKPLDHSVYDAWQSIGVRKLSNDGQKIYYEVNPQEGDKTLFLYLIDTKEEIKIERGEKAAFTNDSKFAAFQIKPFYKDIKAVKNKKKKEYELAKDSLGIYDFTKGELQKIANVKSFKIPEKGTDYIAYLLEKQKDTIKGKSKPTAKGEDKTPLQLIVMNLVTSNKIELNNVVDYYFNEKGTYLVYATANPDKKKAEAKDENNEKENEEDKSEVNETKNVDKKVEKSVSYGVFAIDLKTQKQFTLFEGEGEFTRFSFDKNGEQVVFTFNNDEEKTLVKTYTIYYSKLPKAAKVLLSNKMTGMPKDWVVSENYTPVFSKNGKRLYFGTAPMPIAKDTTLIADDHAVVDIWHFNEDYLQPQQLVSLDKDLKRSYLATIDLSKPSKMVQLADINSNSVSLVDEGDASIVFLSSDFGRRVERQWNISGVTSYYIVDVATGNKKLVVKDLPGRANISPKGTAVAYFNSEEGNWYLYDVKSGKTKWLNNGLNVSFADEEFDMPDNASAYGLQGWTLNDESVLLRDRFDIWEFFVRNEKPARMVTNGYGRKNTTAFSLMQLNPEERAFNRNELQITAAFNEKNKDAGFYSLRIKEKGDPTEILMENFSGFNSLIKANDKQVYAFVKGNFTTANELFVGVDLANAEKISTTNQQQQEYNWGTNELISWTTPNGFDATGVLFKPEDFDPNKKYPMIVYFYEKLSDNLNRYEAPAPTPSRLNIPFFVSNGYLVFTPDVSYIEGYPGKSAEEYINSGVDFLKENSWVDGDKIAIQGQSWGGYQVAHLVTVTDKYAAAWSGAPVVNMTSAYGGIRWQTGMSRQFQYEKTQSRIGKDLWGGYDLYIENSPLFKVPNITTPLVIMHNDNDGAVPWYQGIEMYMAMRRLGKPVWMLNYNGDEHNLMKRQNRKDIQIRQQQFFDYYLKGAKAPVWMVKGIPATMKGKDWGFELTEEKVQ